MAQLEKDAIFGGRQQRHVITRGNPRLQPVPGDRISKFPSTKKALLNDPSLLMGSDIQAALKQLQDICTSIEHWRKDVLPFAQYRAPIVDWHHPDDYAQKGVAGLRKFQSTVEAERDHVASVSNPSALYSLL